MEEELWSLQMVLPTKASIKTERKMATERLSTAMAPYATKESSKTIFHMVGGNPTMKKGDKNKESSSAE